MTPAEQKVFEEWLYERQRVVHVGGRSVGRVFGLALDAAAWGIARERKRAAGVARDSDETCYTCSERIAAEIERVE